MCGKGEIRLSSDQPHQPAGDKHAAQKHREAVDPVADHVASRFTMSNAEDDGREQCEYQRRAEMIKSNSQ